MRGFLVRYIRILQINSFVFKSRCANVGELLKELGMYIVTTGISGTIDLVGVPFLVGGLAFDKKIAKYIMAVVVIIVNYILRKKIVFRKKRKIIEVDWKIIEVDWKIKRTNGKGAQLP